MKKREKPWDSRPVKFNAGEVAGLKATFPWRTTRDAATRPLFPPMDRALVQALACEVVAQTKQPLSRQSVDDLTARAQQALEKSISRSTVWRILDEAVLKPWQYEHWLFPRDPDFAKKAAPILNLYAGHWEGAPLGPKDCVLSCDEKTSIQARRRCHGEMPPAPHRRRRVESEYQRKGALQYLAAWDVGRGIVVGRCEEKTGIEPFGRLVDQILQQDPYRSAERLFLIVDNGSSHRGQASIQRMKSRDARIHLLHTPIHASWINQVEIYFSILQRKVLTPNDFADLDELRVRLELYAELSNQHPKPFLWKFTGKDLENWLQRALPHFQTPQAA